MKRLLPFLAVLVFTVSTTSCNQMPADAKLLGELRQQQDSLSKVVSRINDDFEILKQGLERRGLSMDQMRAEIEAENRMYTIPENQSPVYGKATAPITIVEFSDFQCPYCARIAPAMKEITTKYPDEVRLVYKHFPLSFHKNAPPAHAASMAAQAQGKFWEFRYAIAPHFKDLNDSVITEVAKQIGLDMARFNKDRALDASKQAVLDADIQLGQNIGVNGTPNFFVNGRKSSRFSPDLIDQMVANLRAGKPIQ